MTISNEMTYLLGGGVALLLLKEAIKFIQWGIVKLSNRKSTQPVDPSPDTSPSEKELLGQILKSLAGTNKDVSALAVSAATLEAKMTFIADECKKLGDGARLTQEKIDRNYADWQKQVQVCMGRFATLETLTSERRTKSEEVGSA